MPPDDPLYPQMTHYAPQMPHSRQTCVILGTKRRIHDYGIKVVLHDHGCDIGSHVEDVGEIEIAHVFTVDVQSVFVQVETYAVPGF